MGFRGKNTLLQDGARLRPDYAVAHHNLANALQKLGRHEDTAAEANEVPANKRTTKTSKISK
jgi:hypothetical protein